MYCPECGSEAGDAKFCPECGADLSAVRGAVRGAKGGARGAAKKSGGSGPQPKPAPSRGPSPMLLWGGIAIVAVVAVVLVVVFAGDSGDGTAATGDGGTASVTPVDADTSGSYRELVARANDLYDQGDQLFQQNQIEQGAQYFAAAAKVYEAAWQKQADDPNVGTDWATALFYSGDIEGAVNQIDVVIKNSPDFQTAWFNKGNYLTHEARITEQMGDKKEAKKLYEEARQAYTKAVSIDPASEVGKEADSRLQDLPS